MAPTNRNHEAHNRPNEEVRSAFKQLRRRNEEIGKKYRLADHLDIVKGQKIHHLQVTEEGTQLFSSDVQITEVHHINEQITFVEYMWNEIGDLEFFEATFREIFTGEVVKDSAGPKRFTLWLVER